jgi:hypothetical protein
MSVRLPVVRRSVVHCGARHEDDSGVVPDDYAQVRLWRADVVKPCEREDNASVVRRAADRKA